MDDTRHTVNLEEVNYRRFVGVLLSAAEDVGLVGEIEEVFEQNYRIESEDVRRVDDYDHTDVNLSLRGSPVMSLNIGDKREPITCFQVNRDFGPEIFSRELAESYLCAVSNRL